MQEKQQALRVIYTQLTLLLVVSLVGGLVSKFSFAVSVVLGGIAVIIPTILMLLKVFSAKNSTPTQKVNALYKAEFIKLVATALLVFIILKTLTVIPLGFFIGFITTLLAYWVELIRTMKWN